MRVVVPLAGPDFVKRDGSVKAEVPIDGQPLLRRALDSRPWSERVARSDYVFVLRDRPETRHFAAALLAEWYPGAATVFLGQDTLGAALSSLAGVALASASDGPLIVDLADILYTASIDPETAFAADRRCGGIALTFPSTSPAYSYLRVDDANRFVEAAEKKVISRHASAGTYLFSGAAVFLRAVAHALENRESQQYAGLFYVCPLFNGVRAAGYEVALAPVTDVFDLKFD